MRNMNDEFLTFKVEITLHLTSIDTQFEEDGNLMKLFVGYEFSNNMLRRLQILCNDFDTRYRQNEYTEEGFEYSTITTRHENKIKKYTHSLY